MLVTLTLVLPAFTTSSGGATYTTAQLMVMAAIALTIYAVFVLVQTSRHRDYFLPDRGDTEEEAFPVPAERAALLSLGLLVACLVSVVGLAKTLSPTLEDVVSGLGATASTVAVGSGMASIGLTIPSIAVASLFIDVPLQLGLGGPQIVLLALAVFISGMTVSLGRVTILQGTVHLSVFAAFLFTAFVP